MWSIFCRATKQNQKPSVLDSLSCAVRLWIITEWLNQSSTERRKFDQTFFFKLNCSFLSFLSFFFFPSLLARWKVIWYMVWYGSDRKVSDRIGSDRMSWWLVWKDGVIRVGKGGLFDF